MGEVIKRQIGGRFIGWYIRYYDADGKRRIKASKQTSYADARRMLLQIEAQRARGEAGVSEPRSRITIAELCAQFLDASHPRAKSAVAYRRAAASSLNRILPLLGSLRLDKLRRRDIEQARDKLSQHYKPNTVRSSLRPLGAALTWAVQQDLIAQSPMYKIIRPRLEYSDERLTTEEASALLAEARSQSTSSQAAYSLFIGIALALRLGLRRGEVFGLRWSDVDLKGMRITVARSFEALPKNGKARTLPIPSALAEDLLRWQTLRSGSAVKSEKVCPLGTHSRFGLANLLKAAGCKSLARGWHGLRHTFASIFIEQGGSILALKEMLGHASLAMSLIYSHLTPSALARDIEKMKL
jgi:integrase